MRALDLMSSWPLDEKSISDWIYLSQRRDSLPHGICPTSHPALAALLHKILASDTTPVLISEKSSQSLLAILPLYHHRNETLGLPWTQIGCIANLYPGRAGILFNSDDQESVDAAALVSQKLFDHSSKWDVLSLTLTAGGPTEELLIEAAEANQISFRIASEMQIPYIEMNETWDSYFGKLSKKFRYTIRNGEKQLRKVGNLELAVFSKPDDVEPFLQCVDRIERKSWKHRANTSLSTNAKQQCLHQQLAPVAAKFGILKGFVLLLDETPIAHIYGLSAGRVFCDLKESFDDAYSQYSVGSVLKSLALQELMDGSIHYWDFIGPTEFHKRRFTDKHYLQRQYIFYRSSLAGRFLKARFGIRQIVDRFRVAPTDKSATFTS